MDHDRFKTDVRDANKAGRTAAPSVIAWTVAGIVVIALILGGFYLVRLATAPARGTGDTILKDHDADNRIAQQRAFVTMYEGVKASDAKLQVLADTMTRTPADVKAHADNDRPEKRLKADLCVHW